MDSSQVRAIMPADILEPKDNDLRTRQRALTYWLLYVRKLYEEGHFSMVLETIAALRTKNLLRDVDAQGGYDDGSTETEEHYGLTG
jgi:hypothetical protein